jgi:hypothetical protein
MRKKPLGKNAINLLVYGKMSINITVVFREKMTKYITVARTRYTH